MNKVNTQLTENTLRVHFKYHLVSVVYAKVGLYRENQTKHSRSTSCDRNKAF
jgi:hypothetical protein